MRSLENKHDCNFIIMGDFNIDLNTDSVELQKILHWGSSESLVNVYLNRFDSQIENQTSYIRDTANDENKMSTWYGRDVDKETSDTSGRLLSIDNSKHDAIPNSHLDHVWVSRDLQLRGCIKAYSICSQAVANSDHRLVTISLDIKEALGIEKRDYQ